MTVETSCGIALVALGGLIMGAGAWPMKLMRTFQFEHWWFLAVLFGLVLIPWSVTLVCFPQLFDAIREPAVQEALLIANALALCWGVANLLCGLCYVRIGIALTQAILTGLGVSVVVTAPMVFKGSGQFQDAPDLGTPAGMTILVGVGAMLAAVVFAAMARLRTRSHPPQPATDLWQFRGRAGHGRGCRHRLGRAVVGVCLLSGTDPIANQRR